MGGDTAFFRVSLRIQVTSLDLNFLTLEMDIVLMVVVKIDNLYKKVSSVHNPTINAHDFFSL